MCMDIQVNEKKKKMNDRSIDEDVQIVEARINREDDVMVYLKQMLIHICALRVTRSRAHSSDRPPVRSAGTYMQRQLYTLYIRERELGGKYVQTQYIMYPPLCTT